jgi:CheY-like chemotaxis protein
MLTALVVAAESDSRTLLAEKLGTAGYAVAVVTTSREAGQRLETAGTPSLIIWWIGRPTMDDLKLARAIKDRSRDAPLPVIYLHGQSELRKLLDKLDERRV